MKKVLLLSAFLLPLTACFGGGVPETEPSLVPQEPEAEPVIEESDMIETANVTHQGIVRPAGISVYMQGSHRLQLVDGKFILLESDSVDLNGYVGEEVTVTGALRPTVEAGGMIMRVDRIRLAIPDEDVRAEDSDLDIAEDAEEPNTEDSSNNAKTTDTEDTKNPSDADDTEEKEPETEMDKETASAGDAVDDDSASADDAKRVEESEEMDPEEVSAEKKVRIDAMAKEDFSDARWTQQYCTGHIGFCVPVHKNWWFHSFGATDTSLWHVEMNSEAFETLYQGVVQIDLHAGTLESAGARDGQIISQSGKALGYRSWKDGRHFVISAPDSLMAAVQYITDHLAEFTE